MYLYEISILKRVGGTFNIFGKWEQYLSSIFKLQIILILVFLILPLRALCFPAVMSQKPHQNTEWHALYNRGWGNT